MQQTNMPPATQTATTSPPATPTATTSPPAKPLGNNTPYQSGSTAARPPASGPSGRLLWIVILVLVAGAIGFIVWRAKSIKAAATAMTRRGDLSVPITTGKVTEKEVAIYFDGLGTVQAFNTVTVKPRVDGQLILVAFTEGQDVRTNDLLAQIDPGPFKAALDQAQAKKSQDQALLDNAKLDLQRDLDLTNIVTVQTLDTQSNLVRQLEAMVNTDQAGIDSCQVQLDYTTIRAPLEGRCGIRPVDQGNIVHATDTNGIVVITQLRPISVVFTLPEQDVGPISRKLAKARSRCWPWIATTKPSSTRERWRSLTIKLTPPAAPSNSRRTFPIPTSVSGPANSSTPASWWTEPTAWWLPKTSSSAAPMAITSSPSVGMAPIWWRN